VPLALSRLANRAKGVLAYTRGEPKNTARPVELIVEITNVCNLACPMCPRPHMTRKLGFMDIGLFKRIIDQVKDTAELVYLAGGLGDPTIHPKLAEFIRYCGDSGVRVGISTNATLLKPKMTRAILDAGPDILLLSLDGATKETHEKIRVGSKFETTMARVEAFLTEKARRGLKRPHTVCQMVYMPINQEEAVAFQEKWASFPGVDAVRLKKFLHLQDADYVPESDGDLNGKRSCILPWRQLAISYDGKMALCCRDLDFKHPVGNVAETPIAELWNGPEVMQCRSMLANGRKSELASCRGCAGITGTPLTLAAAALVDDYALRRLLPYAEKVVRTLGVKALDYE
jgi:MoaA/NifB/PqqE/SkfB family radical SAM enzyme